MVYELGYTDAGGEEHHIGNITEFDKEYEFYFEIPEDAQIEELKNGKKRIYSVIRVHNGEFDIVDIEIDKKGRIKVKSSKYSDFILVYQDIDADVAITEQPNPQIAAIGETAEFTVTASGAELTYQWQFNDNGVWKNSGMTGCRTNTLSVPVTAARDGQKYRCVVTASSGESVTSEIAAIIAKPIIIAQPKNAEGIIGETAKFTVTANGKNLTYQWQFNDNGVWKNSGMTGAKTATLSVPITSARDRQRYRCVVTAANGNSIESSAAAIIVKTEITEQPKEFAGNVGDTAKFTVTATGKNLTYQWQFNDNGVWKNSGMTGAQTATLSVPVTTARNGQQYRCIVKSANGTSEASNAATLKVSVGITGQPQNATGKVGDTVKFTVTASNATYQWQFLSTAGWKASGMTGAKTATISVPVTEARDGQKYRCIVKFTDGSTKTSSEVSLNVQSAITAQPQNASGKVGETAKFTVSASGTNITFQWQFLSTTGWKDSGMTGTKTATISVPITAARNGQQYRCVVSSANGTSATSNAAKLNIKS